MPPHPDRATQWNAVGHRGEAATLPCHPTFLSHPAFLVILSGAKDLVGGSKNREGRHLAWKDAPSNSRLVGNKPRRC